MNARETVFWICLINLAIGVVVIATIPQESWKYMTDRQMASYGFLILLGICGVLIAFLILEDVNEIRTLQVRIERLEDWQNQLNMERHKEEKRQREEKKKG